MARFGIDIRMTTEAIASGARVCQSCLGAKIYNPKDPATDLSAMLMQVMGALFALMDKTSPISCKALRRSSKKSAGKSSLGAFDGQKGDGYFI